MQAKRAFWVSRWSVLDPRVWVPRMQVLAPKVLAPRVFAPRVLVLVI